MFRHFEGGHSDPRRGMSNEEIVLSTYLSLQVGASSIAVVKYILTAAWPITSSSAPDLINRYEQNPGTSFGLGTDEPMGSRRLLNRREKSVKVPLPAVSEVC